MSRRPDEETIDRAYARAVGVGELVLSVAREGRAAFLVRLPREGRVRIGRGAEADLCLRSPSLSRLHVELEGRGEAWRARDLGSRNGSLLGDLRLGEAAEALSIGVPLHAGDVRLTVLPARGQPPTARPSWLLSSLEAEHRPGAAVTAIELSTPLDVDARQLDLLSRLPETVRVALVADDVLVLEALDPTAAGWLLGALERAGLAPRRVAAIRGTERAPILAALQALEGGGDAPEASLPAAFSYPSMRLVHAMLRRIAPRQIGVLVHGETGTGKEVVARELHRLSGRKGPLVAVNVAALPETLIESELFGYERGAFSGAQAAKVGLIEASDGGTLFLDELGELPLALQPKLLRVLEDRKVRRIGSNQEREIDLRVVAATHRDLEDLARKERFRQDLVYRVQGATIELLPLRDRREEIPALARALLAELSPDAPVTLTEEASRALFAHSWPGNVRELKHVLERALAFVDGGTIALDHLPASLHRVESQPPEVPRPADPAPSGDVRGSVRDFERERIIAALREAGGNRTRAAELLGLPRRTLVYKLSKLRITDV